MKSKTGQQGDILCHREGYGDYGMRNVIDDGVIIIAGTGDVWRKEVVWQN